MGRLGGTPFRISQDASVSSVEKYDAIAAVDAHSARNSLSLFTSTAVPRRPGSVLATGSGGKITVGPKRAATVGWGTAQLIDVAGATSAAILSLENVAIRLMTRWSGLKRRPRRTSCAIWGRTARKTMSLRSRTC
jgi:hypothetical protein